MKAIFWCAFFPTIKTFWVSSIVSLPFIKTMYAALDRPVFFEKGGGGGALGAGARGGESHHEFTNNNFAFHESRNKQLRFHAL